MPEMFCYQCQETLQNTGCVRRGGVCGKSADVSNLQDLLIYLLKGISFWGTRGRDMGVVSPEADLFVAQALFATITNANFDPARFVELIKKAISLRDALDSVVAAGSPIVEEIGPSRGCGSSAHLARFWCDRHCPEDEDGVRHRQRHPAPGDVHVRLRVPSFASRAMAGPTRARTVRGVRPTVRWLLALPLRSPTHGLPNQAAKVCGSPG